MILAGIDFKYKKYVFIFYFLEINACVVIHMDLNHLMQKVIATCHVKEILTRLVEQLVEIAFLMYQVSKKIGL